MKRFWHKQVVWDSIIRTCALFGGPTTAGLSYFEAASCWVILSGVISLFGAVLGIWFVDANKNGVTDIFEE